MFRLCSTYISTFSTKIRYVSTVLDLCFDSLNQFEYVSTVLDLCFDSLNQFEYVSTVLDLCFDSLDQIRVCFDCVRPMFRLSRLDSGMFRLCPTYILTLLTKIGYILTLFCACLKIASRPRNLSRKTALSRLSVLKNKSSR